MTHLPLVSIITFLPMLGALALMLAGGTGLRRRAPVPRASGAGIGDAGVDVADAPGDGLARVVSIGVSLVTLALAVVMWSGFSPGHAGFQFEDRAAWLPGTGASYHVGVDGVSLALVLLTTFLAPLALIAGTASGSPRIRGYAIIVLLFETTLLGIFVSLDFLLFYVFYEAVLIPSALLVGMWGGFGAARAAVKFFLFTFAGSMVMLLALIAMWGAAGTTDIPVLMATSFSPTMQAWLFWAFVAAFGVKLPMWPLHSWLPDTYAAAPGAGLILFAGALGKAGGYGFLRFPIEMLPDASAHYQPLMIAAGLIAISYAAIIAFAQTDMKRMVAYSSFSHMGVVLVGLFTLTAEGIDGAVFQMLAHGVIIAALFFTVAVLERRAVSTALGDVAGVARRMPVLAVLAMLFVMANVGLPGTGGFVGELLVMIGAVQLSVITALLSGTAMVLVAATMLVLYRRVMFESAGARLAGVVRDLGPGELAVLVPLAVVVLWLGVHPTSFSGLFDPQVTTYAVQHLPAQHFSMLAPAAAPAPGHATAAPIALAAASR